MPGLAELHPALVVHQGLPGVHAISQFRFGKNHIQLNEHIHIQTNGLGIGGGLGRELRQDPLDLLFFFQLQLPQGIVGIHSGHRLHKVCRSGGGDIVDQPRHIIFALGFHGHHIASLPDGDDGLTKELTVGRRGDHLLQAVPDLSGLDTFVPPDVGQLR